MRRLIFCLSACLWLLFPAIATIAQEARTDSRPINPEETVVPNKERYESFKKNPDFDYYNIKIKKPKERNFLSRLFERFEDWLTEKMRTEHSPNESKLSFIPMIVAIIIVVLMLVLAKSLFFRNKGRRNDILGEEDNIYGRDFDKLIEDALKNGDYNQAIRWRFLQTLKWLEDMEIICWNPNKTVIEYSYEVKDTGIRSLFKDISSYFLYFRYGNFQASDKHYLDVDSLATKIIDTSKQ